MYRIAIVGAGGVGGFFGGRLAASAAKSDIEVIFLLREGGHANAIMNNGLQVDSDAVPSFCVPCKVATCASDVGECDAVIVCVKAYSLDEVAPTLKPLLRSGEAPTIVLPLLNGIGHFPVLSGTLGAEHVIGGLCKVFAWIDRPGCIMQRGANHDITFGELDGSVSARIEKLASIFSAAEIPHTVPAAEAGGVRTAMWDKFAAICALSGVGAITRATLGEILSEPRTLMLFEQVLSEGYRVGTAHGAQGLDAGKVDKLVSYLKTLPGSGTASMQRDMLAGKVSELHAQLGAMVEHANVRGVAVPAIELVYAALLPQERVAEARAGAWTRAKDAARGSKLVVSSTAWRRLVLVLGSSAAVVIGLALSRRLVPRPLSSGLVPRL